MYRLMHMGLVRYDYILYVVYCSLPASTPRMQRFDITTCSRRSNTQLSLPRLGSTLAWSVEGFVGSLSAKKQQLTTMVKTIPRSNHLFDTSRYATSSIRKLDIGRVPDFGATYEIHRLSITRFSLGERTATVGYERGCMPESRSQGRIWTASNAGWKDTTENDERSPKNRGASVFLGFFFAVSEVKKKNFNNIARTPALLYELYVM